MEIQHDPARHRFLLELEAGEAYLQYRPQGEKTLDFVSTFVPPAHRHRGIGDAVVRAALEYARAHGYAVIPTCPFVPRVIEAHPEFEALVAGGGPPR